MIVLNLLHKLNPSRGSRDFVHKALTEIRNNSLTKFTEKLLGARRVSQIIPRRGQINATNRNLRVERNLSRVIPTAKHAVEHITVEVADVDRVRSTANDHSKSRVGGILLGVVRLEFLDVLKAFVRKDGGKVVVLVVKSNTVWLGIEQVFLQLTVERRRVGDRNGNSNAIGLIRAGDSRDIKITSTVFLTHNNRNRLDAILDGANGKLRSHRKGGLAAETIGTELVHIFALCGGSNDSVNAAKIIRGHTNSVVLDNESRGKSGRRENLNGAGLPRENVRVKRVGDVFSNNGCLRVGIEVDNKRDDVGSALRVN